MKRVLFFVALLMVTSISFAQVKNVKDAKRIANEVNPDFSKAENLINAALENPETKNDPATWDVAGFVQKRINEKEMEKAYLQQPYDTVKAYNSVLNMFTYYFKADELAEIPDEKGKIRNKYRKPNSALLLAERANLINGGIQYFNEDNSQKALDFFAAYIDAAAHPMFAKENLVKTDSLLPQVAYYASLAAAKTDNYPAIQKYAPYAVNDPEVGQYAMEFLATAYKEQGDTDKFIETLKEGVQKYPEHAYFFGNLIDYYSNENKYDEAMAFADEMLAKDPQNTFYLYVKGYLYHNMKDYQNALKYYKETIEVDPTYAEAYSNIGLIYCLEAQDYADQATADMNDPRYNEEQAEIRKFYEEARPYYEKARQLKPDQQDLWLQGLYRIYYNLNMGPEFEEIDRLMNI
ncbi:MAG: tetratricopeptide repeat protein [Bacteroides sp.]|nr:tetratricopeptide repeat protein [Bacteroides sp.]